jgi:hypothetical protein
MARGPIKGRHNRQTSINPNSNTDGYYDPYSSRNRGSCSCVCQGEPTLPGTWQVLTSDNCGSGTPVMDGCGTSLGGCECHCEGGAGMGDKNPRPSMRRQAPNPVTTSCLDTACGVARLNCTNIYDGRGVCSDNCMMCVDGGNQMSNDGGCVCSDCTCPTCVCHQPSYGSQCVCNRGGWPANNQNQVMSGRSRNRTRGRNRARGRNRNAIKPNQMCMGTGMQCTDSSQCCSGFCAVNQSEMLGQYAQGGTCT